MTPPISQDELDAVADTYRRTFGAGDGRARVVNFLGDVLSLAAVAPMLLNEITRLRAAEQDAGNLLAVIHRDGGHYIAGHGWRKACEDGEAEVLRLRMTAEGRR